MAGFGLTCLRLLLPELSSKTGEKMNLNQITKELEKQAELWEKILNYKTKPKDKGLADAIRKDKPEPKSKQNITLHPGSLILECLDKIYHHIQYAPQLVNKPELLLQTIRELGDEIRKSIPVWPSLEWGDVYKQPVIEHIRSCAQMVRNATKPERLITLAVAAKNFNVSKPTLNRAIKDGRLIAYPQVENAPKNSPLLVDAVKVAKYWTLR